MGVTAYVVDIETTPLIVKTWSMWKTTIQPANIVQDRGILCIGWKKVGAGKRASSVRVGADKTERQMLSEWRAAIDDADILIGHNLAHFDLKHITAKLIEHDLPPLQKLNVIDTLAEVKKVAKFSSNRLDFLCGKLLNEHKLDTDMELWDACMAGDESALERMARYCRHDVEITERLYVRLRPYMKNHPNIAETDSANCPRCNSEIATVRKVYRTKNGQERAHLHCTACMAPFTIAARSEKLNRPLSSV